MKLNLKPPNLKNRSTSKLLSLCGWGLLEQNGAKKRANEVRGVNGHKSEDPTISLLESYIHMVQKCRKKKNLAHSKQVYGDIRNNGPAMDVGNYIVPMFVECGNLSDAQQTFSRLINRNEHAWTSLILGYIESAQAHYAFHLYEKMQQDKINPSSYTLKVLLKACTKLRNEAKSRQVHAQIIEKGYENDLFVGNTLIDMYAKCAMFASVQEVFDRLPIRDVVSWNGLLGGYVENELSHEALRCHKQMQLEGISPNVITFVSILKACSATGSLNKGREMHIEIEQKGFERDPYIGTVLVEMYAKCGSLEEAEETFNSLPVRDIILWNALISAYVENELAEKALQCMDLMQSEAISPDAVTFVSILKACGIMRAIDKGREIHRKVSVKGLERDIFVGSALIDMYAKCGLIKEAQEVFDVLPVRDIILWNTMITGYAENRLGEEALKCFDQMRLEGISPDAVTFVCSIKACGSIGAIDKGKEIHFEIATKNLEKHELISSSLVSMYARCGSFEEARDILKKMPDQNVVAWTALISGYAEHGYAQEALNCFEEMRLKGTSPDVASVVCSLKACSILGDLDKGREIHALVVEKGFQREAFVRTALISMYTKCGSLREAQEVFNALPTCDVVCWNALTAGYAEHGSSLEVLNAFEQMKLHGLPPDAASFVCILKACTNIGALEMGREIHTEIKLKGWEKDAYVGNSLVDMYVKCGSLLEAADVFKNLPGRDIVTWNALITGHVENGYSLDALRCVDQMKLEGISPDVVTFVSSLKACGSIGALDKGRQIHKEALEGGFDSYPLISNTLIDMYAKCGSLLEARNVFDNMRVQDVVSWNTMIRGYGVNHEADMAFKCFEGMHRKGIEPDAITFMCVFTACGRSSLVFKGRDFFEAMREQYGIVANADHYSCMTDLLARSGHLYEAEIVLQSFQYSSTEPWRALLSACKSYGETELGLKCFQRLIQMNPYNAASYTLMANIYASADRWDAAHKIEELRKTHVGQ